MDLRQIGYVVAIVDHGGFTRAAEALGVSQPTLSQAVRALEAELGTELFHRTSRRVVITAAGEALLGPGRQALRDAENARAAVAAVIGVAAGSLDLVCLPTLAVYPAAELIGRFRRAHPAVAIRMVEPEDADSVAERVRNGSSEVGLTELPVAGTGFAMHTLERQEYVALVPKPLAVAGSGTITIRELAAQPLVTTPPGTSTRRQLDEAFAAAGRRPTIAVETDHREAIGPLVSAGAGIALLPRRLAEASRLPGVAVVEIRPRITRRIGVLHREGPLSPAAAAFLATAVTETASPTRPRPRRRS
jgi:LysR family carnitine catabolism transcriptional activator